MREQTRNREVKEEAFKSCRVGYSHRQIAESVVFMQETFYETILMLSCPMSHLCRSDL
jgi:hypothetical protein